MEKERLDQLIEKVGGRERLVQTLQRRLRELAYGGTPLIETPPRDLVETALQEAFEGRLSFVPPAAPMQERVPFGRPPATLTNDGGRPPTGNFEPRGPRPPFRRRGGPRFSGPRR
jgi:DNA-directed RNA polymerase subunit K/omega